MITTAIGLSIWHSNTMLKNVLASKKDEGNKLKNFVGLASIVFGSKSLLNLDLLPPLKGDINRLLNLLSLSCFEAHFYIFKPSKNDLIDFLKVVLFALKRELIQNQIGWIFLALGFTASLNICKVIICSVCKVKISN